MVGVGIVFCHGWDTIRYLILYVHPSHSIAKGAGCRPKVPQQAAVVTCPTL